MTIVINQDEPEDTASFAIPEALLVEKSEFFKAACRNGWKEAGSRIIVLPEVDVDAFYAYVHWIYYGAVAVSSGCRISLSSAAETEPTLNELVELWLLGDRLADTALRNRTMNVLRNIVYSIRSTEKDWAAAFTPDMIARIWSSTTKGRALRRFVVDIYESRITAASLNAVKDSFHPEFLVDLTTKLLNMKSGEDNKVWTLGSRWYYHEKDEISKPGCEN